MFSSQMREEKRKFNHSVMRWFFAILQISRNFLAKTMSGRCKGKLCDRWPVAWCTVLSKETCLQETYKNRYFSTYIILNYCFIQQCCHVPVCGSVGEVGKEQRGWRNYFKHLHFAFTIKLSMAMLRFLRIKIRKFTLWICMCV